MVRKKIDDFRKKKPELLDYPSEQSDTYECENNGYVFVLEQEIRLLNAREAGKVLGVNANTVYSLWNKNLLGYWMIHKSKKTNLRAIAEFLDKTQNKALDTD